jgi:hypothetical protein
VQRLNLKKVFLYLLIASVGVSALIGIGVILLGDFGEFEVKVLLTALTVTVTSILGLACGAYFETGRGRLVPGAGILMALVSGVMWIYLVWHGIVHEDLFVKSLLSLTLLGAACSHISLLSLAQLDRRFMWSRYAVYFAVGSLTAYLLFLVWDVDAISNDVTGRIIGVLAIVVAALTLVTPVLHKLSTGEPGTTAIDAEIEKLRARIAELEAKKAAMVENPVGAADAA